MPLKTLVKVGGITNLSDARYCAGMGVDFLGFQVTEGHKSFIGIKAYQEMRGWVTGPQIVAEIYGITNTQHLLQLIDDYRPDYLELSLQELSAVGGAVTLPFILTLLPGETLPANALTPAYILISPASDHLEKLIPEYDLLIAVGGREELEDALSKTGIAGIALNGGQEIRPGLKDFDDLAEILESLEVED